VILLQTLQAYSITIVRRATRSIAAKMKSDTDLHEKFKTAKSPVVGVVTAKETGYSIAVDDTRRM